jgi:hypothetical protein
MHNTYLCEAYLTVFELAATIVNVITLAVEMPGACALATLAFQMWAVFVPVEVSTAEAWRRRIFLCRWLGWLALLRWWVLAALPMFLQWLLYSVQLDVFISENSTVCVCVEEVYAVSNDVEIHLIAILVKLLQDLSVQGFIGRRFQCGEENECVELFFSHLFEF